MSARQFHFAGRVWLALRAGARVFAPGPAAAQLAVSVEGGLAFPDHREFADGSRAALGVRFASLSPKTVRPDVSLLYVSPLTGELDLDFATALRLGQQTHILPRAGGSLYGGQGGAFVGWNAGVGLIVRAAPRLGLRLDTAFRMLEYRNSADAMAAEPLRMWSVTVGLVSMGSVDSSP